MKRNIVLSLCALFVCFAELLGQTYYFSKPQGYGAGTTGGGTASKVTVTTEATLKAALVATGSKVILVKGTITITAPMKVVVVNKTLLGLPGAKLVNTSQTTAGSGILYLNTGSSNVIIRNLIFESGGAYDIDGGDNLTSKGCNKLWVDHCEFQDGVDGNLDIIGTSDNVTISWCKFMYKKPAKAGGLGVDDHRFSNLIGSSDFDKPADGLFNITFQNCYWAEGCKQRMPRARNAQLHLLNCYYNTSVTGSIALGVHNYSKWYVENTHFAKVEKVFLIYDQTGSSLSFFGCLGAGGGLGTTPKPTYTYSSFPVAGVASAITSATCGAGATLKVTTAGVISSSCANAREDMEAEVEVASFSRSLVYPNPAIGPFFVKGKEDIAKLTVMDMSGNEMAVRQNISAGTEVAIEEQLPGGMYLVKFVYQSGAVEQVKYMKTK